MIVHNKFKENVFCLKLYAHANKQNIFCGFHIFSNIRPSMLFLSSLHCRTISVEAGDVRSTSPRSEVWILCWRQVKWYCRVLYKVYIGAS